MSDDEASADRLHQNHRPSNAPISGASTGDGQPLHHHDPLLGDGMNTHLYQDGKAVTARSIATAVDAGDLTIPQATELIDLLVERATQALRDENDRLRLCAGMRQRTAPVRRRKAESRS
ncbi:hypothetical protein [Burkholderia glumae]|uniref:hypothetical protein n=1 Tax=Burkholderia glumae TaxID=337 RepID=UPI0020CC7649|nr:hypothetical protein [Burkholderia glumae]MCQ0031506.1 hypothetical protein [Burkholderia glumae]MCQ0035158.1 hypothetical protein [Burkholderia glumae]